MSAIAGPLQGLKVVELAQIMAGPTCGLMLADLGADVIKVEKLPDGDDSRSYRQHTIDGESAPFLVMNRNKRGIAVNLKLEGGRAAVERLVANADVLIENYRPGTLEKLGLGYAVLRQLNPRLIYCAISGYGRTGPYADRGGFDLIAQGVSGLMSVTGQPGGEPMKAGTPVSDINAGILAALGVVSAVVNRNVTGRGQMVDTSLMEAAVQQTYWQSALYFATGANPQPTGSSHLLAAPYQAFPTRDGWINIGGANQANWERIAAVIGSPELVDDPRFKTNADRMAHKRELADVIAARTITRDSAVWIADLDAAGVPVGPINKIGDMLADPQVAARAMVVEVDHPKAGKTRALGLPIKFSETPGSVRTGAPRLGQHTREVLLALGYGEAEIEDLVRSGAVACG
ncbi:CoA transferase [Variovorax paradoxus]|nr:CoA transferase [Variovorax paradoxus]